MSWLVSDCIGARLYNNKPVREIFKGEEYEKRKKLGYGLGIWKDEYKGGCINIPDSLPKILNDNHLLGEHYVPFEKRNMNFGDSPIYVKEI